MLTPLFHLAAVLLPHLALSKRHPPEEDHVHLYDFAILTDQRGVYTTYVFLAMPCTHPHVMQEVRSNTRILEKIC